MTMIATSHSTITGRRLDLAPAVTSCDVTAFSMELKGLSVGSGTALSALSALPPSAALPVFPAPRRRDRRGQA